METSRATKVTARSKIAKRKYADVVLWPQLQTLAYERGCTSNILCQAFCTNDQDQDRAS